jgi:hypothetical protein
MLMENANLTRAQDLGADTELLSGDFFVPFGRSTSHQLWSSAMVITPTLRGLFGIDIDAQTKTITVNPHLPAGWDVASVRNLQLPGGSASLVFRRTNGGLETQLTFTGEGDWRLKSDVHGATSGARVNTSISKKTRLTPEGEFRIPLPALEIDQTLSTIPQPRTGWMPESSEIMMNLPNRPPIPGSRTARFRIVRSDFEEHNLTLVAEGIAGSEGVVSLIRNSRIVPKIASKSDGSAGSNSADVKLLLPDEGGRWLLFRSYSTFLARGVEDDHGDAELVAAGIGANGTAWLYPHPYPVSKVPSFNGLERGVALRSSWGRASLQNPLGKGVRGDFWRLAKILDPCHCLPARPIAEGIRSLPYRYGATAGEIIGKSVLEVLRLY